MVDFGEFKRLLERRVAGDIDRQWARLLSAIDNRESLWYTVLDNKLQTHLLLLRLDDIDNVKFEIYRYKTISKPTGWLVVIRLEYDD